MLFERPGLSRKPAELAEQELRALRDEDRLTPVRRPRAGLSASGSSCMRGLQDGLQTNLDKDEYKKRGLSGSGAKC